MNHTTKKVITFLFTLYMFVLLSGCATKRQLSESSPKYKSVVTADTRKETDIPKKKQKPIIQTGRYSAVVAAPTEQQRHLLEVMISITVPNEIKTIRQAIMYLLKRSGYELSNPTYHQKELAELFIKQLPKVHRQIGPMTLKDALNVLTGPAFSLKQDEVHRRISYQLDKQYLAEKF